MDARTEKMVSMYQHGATLQRIGEQFKLTRERVRQIIRPHIAGRDGGIALKAASKRERFAQQRDARSQLSHGVSWEELKLLRSERVTHAYHQQQRNAAARAVPWLLSFAEWLSIWKASGKLQLRGRGKGRYVMSRICDDGPYAVGNVHIQLATENSREAVDKWRGKVKENKGVYLLYPGYSRPWAAAVGGKRLGNFATESDAVAARREYLAANPEKPHLSVVRGYSLVPGGERARRYQVIVGGAYVGRFYTEQEAIAARAEYMRQSKSAPADKAVA